MKDDLVVASLQMTSTPSMQRNLETAERLIAQAVEDGAEVVVLPDHFLFFGNPSERVEHVVLLEKTAGEFLSEAASDHGVMIIAGGVACRSTDKERIYNSAVVYDREGKKVHSYNKMHVFDAEINGNLYQESKSTVPGAEPPQQFILPNGFSGCATICYDLRFPELFRGENILGCEVFFVSAAFTPTTGIAHWEVLLRARAIENTAYVVASAQVGQHYPGRASYGDSMIIDPWGEVLDRLPNGEGVLVSSVTRQRLEEVRSQLPALSHCKMATRISR